MALGVPAPAMDPAAVLVLHEKLLVHWPRLVVGAQFFAAPGGANKGGHIVVKDSNGLIIGLKAAERVLRGTKTELVVSRAARRLDLPLAPLSHLLTGLPAGLGGLSSRSVVATEWRAQTEALDKAQPQELQANVQHNVKEFLHCYGQWLAFGLALGTQDRHTGNWICSTDGRAIGMIDLEGSLEGEARPEEFRMPLDHPQIALLSELRNESPNVTDGLRGSLQAGLRHFHNRWFSSAQSLRATLAPHGWCGAYSNPWWISDQDSFVTQVVTRLLS